MKILNENPVSINEIKVHIESIKKREKTIKDLKIISVQL